MMSDLRARVAALAEQLDREADGICPVGHYDKKDKAWRVAHVRRRVAEDLRALLSETERCPACPFPAPDVPAGECCHDGGREVPGVSRDGAAS